MWNTIGHEWALALLNRAIADKRVAHTILITGPAHIGKTHLARELAAALNCSGEAPPCLQCTACRKTLSDAHPDVMLIEPDNGRIKIEQIRRLQHELALSPFEGQWRVCILTDFQSATREASNALLKTLEEPPGRSVLILTAIDAGLLLPTIVSRCQLLSLRAVPQDVIARALVERWQASEAHADVLARISAGRVGWAISAIHDPRLLEERRRQLDIIPAALQHGPADRILVAERLSKSEANITDLAHLWQTWWRDVMLVSAGCEGLVANADDANLLAEAAQQCGLVQATQAARACEALVDQLEHNVNQRLALEVLLLGWPRIRLPEAEARAPEQI
ncbi:MAG: DNA polymerase III subunit delta' [Anaerolineae bacterium]|nr:DNA polymerase III subunit delta' [Anaerolineae bacterium]